MGYNANLMKTGSIPTRKGAAGVAVVYAAIPQMDQRVTIPYLRCRTGAPGGNLEVLQTEGVYKFSLLAAGSVIAVPGIPATVTGRQVVLRFPSGETKATVISAQTGENLTLGTSIAPQTNVTLYLMGNTSSESTAEIPLTASAVTILQAECPGFTAGKEIGWPVVLYIRNTDGACVIEGGTVAYIGV
ncbi:hypothetical protein K7J14_02635 [Treponema zuelzerae]|uniref:Uncharacterized protein n=1 Tax=Teretinema zuelzerae TaxID=156 RepID=A0AAE3EG79_9SPIR|nr:hypothetical protein [Teretinema zuelzerae]MCD1653595.1 hypothetical protein [Teretinema zuelzerae]